MAITQGLLIRPTSKKNTKQIISNIYNPKKKKKKNLEGPNNVKRKAETEAQRPFIKKKMPSAQIMK